MASKLVKSMTVKERMWVIEDHICQKCGGRILRCLNPGFTPGGSPIFRCADCGASDCGMGPQRLCWCGYEARHINADGPVYMCLPMALAKEKPELRTAFLRCGCDPDRPGRSQIGVILEDDYRKVCQGERV